MRIIVNIVFVFLIGVFSSDAQDIKTEEYYNSNYDKVEVASFFDLEIKSGGEGVSVTCDKHLLPAIKVQQDGSKLRIALDKQSYKKNNATGVHVTTSKNIFGRRVIKVNGRKIKEKVQVTVYVNLIKEIRNSSSGTVKWEGSLPTRDIKIVSVSSGDIVWKGRLRCDRMHVEGSASGHIKGDFEGGEALVDLLGSCEYSGKFVVKNLKVKVAGFSSFKGDVDTGRGYFSLNSSSDAKLVGKSDLLFVEVSGFANFNGNRLEYKKAEVRTSSSAHIFLSNTGKIVDKNKMISPSKNDRGY